MDNKISIICPTYNVKGCIRNLIESVIKQTSKNFELIIVDGGSKDGTTDILEEYKDKLIYISEPDCGIYDAMNKGINLSSGDWLYFIGADDSLFGNDVVNQAQIELENKDIDILLCKINVPKVGVLDSTINWRLMFKNYVNHQGAIYRKNIFNEYRYNLAYSISADYDLNCYVWRNNYKSQRSNIIFANHPFDGASGQASFNGYKEEIQIRHKYFNSITIDIVGFLFTLSRFLFRKIKVFIGI